MNGSSAAGAAAPAQPAATSVEPSATSTTAHTTSNTAGTAATAAPASSSAQQVATQAEPSSTARRLRTLGVASVLACTLTGAAGYLVIDSDSAQTAAAASQQSERLSRIETSVGQLRSEAGMILKRGEAATNTSSAYDAALSSLSRDLVAAASTSATSNSAAEADEYGSINAALNRYATTVERARVAAAAGQPTAELARQADALLDKDVAAPVGQLQQRTTDVAKRSQTSSFALVVFLGLATALSLAVLIGGGVWLARKTHRVVNPPMVAATLLTVGVSAVAAATQSQAATLGVNIGALGGLAQVPFAGPLLLLGGLGAGALAWAGVSQRLREYR